MRLSRNTTGIGVLLMTLAASGCGRPDDGGDGDPRVRESLKTELASKTRPAYATADAEGTRLWKLTRAFYERRHHSLAWIDDEQPRPQMDALLRAVRSADREGLDPELYGLRFLESRRQEALKGFLTKKGFEPAEAGQQGVTHQRIGPLPLA